MTLKPPYKLSLPVNSKAFKEGEWIKKQEKRRAPILQSTPLENVNLLGLRISDGWIQKALITQEEWKEAVIIRTEITHQLTQKEPDQWGNSRQSSEVPSPLHASQLHIHSFSESL